MKILNALNNYKIIIKNAGYLSALEIFKLIMPFVALPYIIRVVGGTNYGLIVFVQTIISYFSVLINFGLDISAVKNVAILRNDKDKLSELVSSVLSIKFLLWLVSLLLLIICFLFSKTIRSNSLLVVFAFLSCFADVLFPVWYFQGMERMKYITLIRFFSILFYTITIFIFIHSAEDYIFIPLLQSVGLLISGILSVYLLLKVDKLQLRFVRLCTMKTYFIESIPFFVSRLSLLVNSGMAKIVCGIFFSMHSVAAFDLAQKIATTSFVPLQMINQSVFPHLARTRDRLFAKRCFVFMIACSFFIITLIYILAPFAVYLFAGKELTDAAPILRILCLYVFFGGLSLYLGTPILVAFGYPKIFNTSVIASTIILLLSYLLLYWLNLFTVHNFALIVGLTEFSIFIYRFFYCLKNKILFM